MSSDLDVLSAVRCVLAGVCFDVVGQDIKERECKSGSGGVGAGSKGLRSLHVTCFF